MSLTREEAVVEMLQAGRTLESIAVALKLSVNAVVQMRELLEARMRQAAQEDE